MGSNGLASSSFASSKEGEGLLILRLGAFLLVDAGVSAATELLSFEEIEEEGPGRSVDAGTADSGNKVSTSDFDEEGAGSGGRAIASGAIGTCVLTLALACATGACLSVWP